MSARIRLLPVLGITLVLGGCMVGPEPATVGPGPTEKAKPAVKRSPWWQVRELPTSADFLAVQLTGDGDGWIAGGGILVDGGLVGRTTDGGASWSFESGLVDPVPGTSVFHVNDMHFFDPFRGVAVTSNGHVLMTYDSGESWKVVRQGQVSFPGLRDLSFVDDRHGFAIGERGLLATRDGGESWKTVFRKSADNGYLTGRAIHFVDERHGHMARKLGRILRTFDGGVTWEEPERMPTLPGDSPPDLFAIFFVDDKFGWAVGESGTVLHTPNGGKSWHRKRTGVGDFLHDVRFIDRSRGWAVGHDRRLRRSVVLGSEDGGESWTVELELDDEQLTSLHTTADGQVWAVGRPLNRGAQVIAQRAAPSGV